MKAAIIFLISITAFFGASSTTLLASTYYDSGSLPYCAEPEPGKAYITLLVMCKCPDGTVQSSNGGYATCYPKHTPAPIPYCMDPVPSKSYITLYVLCKCPDGTTHSSNGGYYRCDTLRTIICPDGTVIYNSYGNVCPTYKYCPDGSRIPSTSSCPVPIYCWDGSIVYSQNSCPQYKYCPGDSKKYPHSHICYTPPIMQTCWDGSVISVTAYCRSKPTCSYYQYWNGYSCINNYYNQQPSNTYYYYDTVPTLDTYYPQYNNYYSNYGYQNYTYDVYTPYYGDNSYIYTDYSNYYYPSYTFPTYSGY